MSKGLFSYFKLGVFCLKLIFNLFLFTLELGISKIGQKKALSFLLLALLLLSLSLNFFLWREKNTEQLIVVEIEQNLPHKESLKTESLNLSQQDLTALENWLLFLNEKRNIKSQQIYLNLSELEKIKNNPEKIQKYLEKAREVFSL